MHRSLSSRVRGRRSFQVGTRVNPVGSVIFRGDHVRPAEQTVVMQIPSEELYRLRWEDDGRMQHPNLPAFNRAIDEHRAVVVFGDDRSEHRLVSLGDGTSVPLTIVQRGSFAIDVYR